MWGYSLKSSRSKIWGATQIITCILLPVQRDRTSKFTRSRAKRTMMQTCRTVSFAEQYSEPWSDNTKGFSRAQRNVRKCHPNLVLCKIWWGFEALTLAPWPFASRHISLSPWKLSLVLRIWRLGIQLRSVQRVLAIVRGPGDNESGTLWCLLLLETTSVLLKAK